MNVQEALELLELENVKNITVNDLKKAVRKKQHKWHPDVIAHKKLPEKEVEEYTKKFRAIQEAQEIIKGILFGENGHKYDGDIPPVILREKLEEELFDKTKEIWSFIKKQKNIYLFEREIVISEGRSVKDAMNSQMESCGHWISGGLFNIILLIIGDFIVQEYFPDSSTANLIIYCLTIVFIAALPFQILLSLPVVGHLLPRRFVLLVAFVIEALQTPFGYIEGTILGKIIKLPESIFHFFITKPICFITKVFFGDKYIERVTNTSWWLDINDVLINAEEIDDLLSKNIDDMDDDDIRSTFLIYQHLRQI